MDAGGPFPRPGQKAFVGRRAERSLLRHLLRGAADGQPAIVVVSGVAGAGKTALLRWLGAQAVAAGATVLHGSAGDECLPPTRFRRLVRPLQPPAAAVTTSPDGSGSEPTAVDATEAGEALEEHLGDEVTDLVIGAARRHLVVVLFDDLHDLDSASGRVLNRVLEGIDAAALHGSTRVLAALATREPVEPGGPVDHALRFDVTRAVHLGGLAEQDVVDLVALAGLRGDPAAIASMVDDTDGLPLLVEAGVEAMRDGAAGTRRRTGIRVRTVGDALDQRFDKVDQTARDLLAVAAHLGEPWRVADVAEVSGLAPDVAVQAVRAAADASLVTAERDVWRFAHPLLRTELLERTSAGDARALHLRIARTLQAHDDGSDAQLVRVADHVLRAGAAVAPTERAAIGRTAGLAALRAGAWRQASQFLSVAAEASAGAPPAERAARHLEAGRAAYMDTDPDAAERELGAAIERAGEAGDDGLAADAAVLLVRTRLGERPLGLGRRPEIGELERALARPGVDPKVVVEGHATMAEALFVSGETDRALALVAAARSVTVSDDAARERCRLEFAEGLHRLAQLELGDAAACFRRAADHATVAQDALWSIVARSRHDLVRWLVGDVAAAARDLRDLEAEAERLRYFGEASFASAQLVAIEALIGSGDPTDVIERALTLYRRSGHAFSSVVADPGAVAMRARVGDPDPPGWADTVDGRARRPSALAALAAVEAGVIDEVRARTSASKWRLGLLGRASIANLAMVVAMVDGGDAIGDADVVAAATRPLDEMAGAGLVVVVGWPALVPRLQATVARWDGRYGNARRHLEHALAVCDANVLRAEGARVQLEVAQLAVAEQRPAADVGALFGAVLRRFDELDMHGWTRRCDELVQALGFAASAGLGRGVRERTFLTTDIVGSTAANARMGNALYLEQLRVHDRLVTARIREHRGQTIKHTGDGLNACFDRAGDAVRCALAVRDDIVRWRADEPDLALPVRFGIARGPVIASGGDYFGLAQSETARLCALAGAEEVVASAAVVEQVDLPGLVLTDLGLQELRGLPTATRAFLLAR